MRGSKEIREMADEELVEAIIKHEVFIEQVEERFGKDCMIIANLPKDKIYIYGKNQNGTLVISDILDLVRNGEQLTNPIKPS